MDTKRFLKNDSGFICQHCGKEVMPLGFTSRNHCPFCLYSLHLDINPGDRAAGCFGLMKPIFVEPDAKKGYIITHCCEKCGAKRRNKAVPDAEIQPDDIRLLIDLTVQADARSPHKHR